MNATPDLGDFERSLAAAFGARGYDLFLVGGALRDELLGREHADLDFATDARPAETRKVLGDLPGVSVYGVGERFGTVGAVWRSRWAEITTYRSAEVYSHGSRQPAVQFGGSLEEDLARRDFTINALARPAGVGLRQPSENESAGHESPAGASGIVDPFGGMADLRAGRVRAVGSPAERFREDPLRIPRGIRIASALGFTIEEATWSAMKSLVGSLREISRERIADELNRMLTGPSPTRAFTLLRDAGVLGQCVPELLDLDMVQDQGPYHAYSLWDHTLRVVEVVQPDATLRWAALLHDIGKPDTMTREAGGRVRFFDHDHLGAVKAERILRSLRMSNQFIGQVSLLVASHMKLHQYTPDWSDGSVRRLRLRLGGLFDDAVSLAEADGRGHGSNPWSRSGASELARRAALLSQTLPAEPESPLNGHDLMERYGRAPGPWVGTVKRRLVEMMIDGSLEPGDTAGAWRIADRLLAET